MRTVPSDPTLTGQLVDPRAVRRHNDPMDLVELARSVQTADKFVYATTSGKLQVIVDTIRSLQEQVREMKVVEPFFLFTLVHTHTIFPHTHYIPPHTHSHTHTYIPLPYTHTYTYIPLPRIHRPALSSKLPRETINFITQPATLPRSLVKPITCMSVLMGPRTLVCSPPLTGDNPLLTLSSGLIV